jgi:hypothetical protein
VAVDGSSPGDTVLLSPGTYSGDGNHDIEFRGKDIVLTSQSGPEVTVIDCESHRGFYMHQHETRAARIEKITISNGWADIEDPGIGGAGGGIACLASCPTISDCVFMHNTADYPGGGLCVLSEELLVERCVFVDNSADEGGAIAVLYGNVIIVDCVIVNNLANRGGGIALTNTYTQIRNTTISGNLAGHGGGIQAYSRADLQTSVLWGNSAFSEGDEMETSGHGADLRCCAINSSGVSGPADYDAFCVFTDPMFCGPPSGRGFSLSTGCESVRGTDRGSGDGMRFARSNRRLLLRRWVLPRH